ncbi:hypothetical protein BV20DRAFT_1021990 [Pilatotrama ljubarskyi]|nr:hypothetical protein BV20DRAFT_1021990 [Pilatotrama ljubarskyi]
MKSFLLVGLVRIGHCDPAEMDLVRVAPVTLFQSPTCGRTVTCRTWMLHIVRLLNDDPTHYVQCPDILALEKEVIEWGLSQWDATSRDQQPPPMIDSKVCVLP